MRHYGAMPPGLPRGDIEDLGAFGVWWYTLQLRGGREERRWAYALRDGTIWRVSACVSHFQTRDEAVRAAEIATKDAT